jgi:hypothetical protein
VRIGDPGHVYWLSQLDVGSNDHLERRLIFVKRDQPPEAFPGNVGHHAGTTSQEVMRVLIDRAKYVDNQISCQANGLVIFHLRKAILALEERAAKRHGRELGLTRPDIENEPTCPKCGHIQHICEEKS